MTPSVSAIIWWRVRRGMRPAQRILQADTESALPGEGNMASGANGRGSWAVGVMKEGQTLQRRRKMLVECKVGDECNVEVEVEGVAEIETSKEELRAKRTTRGGGRAAPRHHARRAEGETGGGRQHPGPKEAAELGSSVK